MDFEVELEALGINCLADPSITYVTQRQVGGVCGLLKQGLQDNSKENQIAVLAILVGPAMREIAGVEIKSRKNLTSHVANTLIDQLLEPDTKPWELSDYGHDLLSAAEKRAKEQAFSY
jgi:hypothetical protein